MVLTCRLIERRGRGVSRRASRLRRPQDTRRVFARALLAVGVRHGDRVALLITNPTEWTIPAFAAAKTGALVAAISTFSTPRELAWAVEHSGAATLITLDVFRGQRFLDALDDRVPAPTP